MTDIGNTRGGFGRRNVPLGGQEKSGRQIEFQVAKSVPSGRKWKDWAFYAAIAVAGVITVGAMAIIVEDPEVRNARLVEEAKLRHRLETEAAERREEARIAREKAAREAARIASIPDLKISGFKCVTEHGYVSVSGMVKNNTHRSIDRLMSVGIFSTSSGDFIKSADAMVDFQPLLPGQSSPFRSMTTDNPAIKNCRVTFKTMFGGEVSSSR